MIGTVLAYLSLGTPVVVLAGVGVSCWRDRPAARLARSWRAWEHQMADNTPIRTTR